MTILLKDRIEMKVLDLDDELFIYLYLWLNYKIIYYYCTRQYCYYSFVMMIKCAYVQWYLLLLIPGNEGK